MHIFIDEDPKDLRGHDEQTLQAFFGKRKISDVEDTPAKQRNVSGDSGNFNSEKEDENEAVEGGGGEGGPSLGLNFPTDLEEERGWEEARVRPSLGQSSSSRQDDFVEMRKEMREKFETLNLKLDSLSLRSRTSGEQEKQPPGSQSDVGLEQKFHCARNIQDLMELEIGLQYDETRNEMFCPCSTQSYFKCPDPEVEALDSDIEDGDQDLVSSQFRQFRNLKKSLKRHMETAGHKTYLIEERRAEEETRKYLSRNLAAGQTLGRIVYMLVKLGRPFQDYEEQVLTAKIGGSEVGDKHHGKDFATKLLRPLSAVVTEDLKNFFSTPLIQTGFRPKLTLSADGATHKHYTRQFIACVTINPDGENFLETVSIGQPLGKDPLELN